jgi:parallel beta-helix repeat protein
LGDGGIVVQGPGSTGNTVTDNTVNDNRADGISLRTGASGNQITNNVMLRNAGVNSFDASGKGAPANKWNFNNVCVTQNAEVPPGVCGPTEGS